MYARQHERQAMKDALEMALLTTVSHPFIIQVRNTARTPHSSKHTCKWACCSCRSTT